MQVSIKLHGALRRHRPAADGAKHRPFMLALEPGATVGMALQALEIPGEVVSALAVNGEQAAVDTVLSDGDKVHIFPPAAGG